MADHIVNWNYVQVDQARTVAALDQARENATRQAVVEISYISSGTGQQRIAKAIDFPVTFVTEPHMVSGCGTVKNPDPKKWNDPIGQSGVWAWKRNKAGQFIGAHIWLRVDIYPVQSVYVNTSVQPVAPAGIKTVIYLTFSGTATKDISVPDISTLTTRTVGIS